MGVLPADYQAPLVPYIDIVELADLLGKRQTALLTGAGMSTESGIPDYRGPSSGRTARQPMRYQEFVNSAGARQRYWSRSTLGWPRMSSARPNDAHRAVAALQAMGHVTGVITQNVDGLHQAAGSSHVLELHGALSRVLCLDCGTVEARGHLQERLVAANPAWYRRSAELAPDGDVDLPEAVSKEFVVLPCQRCGGVLKPDVVFFGENVPAARVEAAYSVTDRAEALLVAGSSLAVYSGLRFVKRAVEAGKPVGIVNLGPTRGDELAALRVEGRLGDVLPQLVDALTQ